MSSSVLYNETQSLNQAWTETVQFCCFNQEVENISLSFKSFIILRFQTCLLLKKHIYLSYILSYHFQTALDKTKNFRSRLIWLRIKNNKSMRHLFCYFFKFRVNRLSYKTFFVRIFSQLSKDRKRLKNCRLSKQNLLSSRNVCQEIHENDFYSILLEPRHFANFLVSIDFLSIVSLYWSFIFVFDMIKQSDIYLTTLEMKRKNRWLIASTDSPFAVDFSASLSSREL